MLQLLGLAALGVLAVTGVWAVVDYVPDVIADGNKYYDTYCAPDKTNLPSLVDCAPGAKRHPFIIGMLWRATRTSQEAGKTTNLKSSN